MDLSTILCETDVLKLQVTRDELASALDGARVDASAAVEGAAEVRATWEAAWAEHGPKAAWGGGFEPIGDNLRGILDSLEPEWHAAHALMHNTQAVVGNLAISIEACDGRIAQLSERVALLAMSPGEHTAAIKAAESALQEAEKRMVQMEAKYAAADEQRRQAAMAWNEALEARNTARSRLAQAHMDAGNLGATSPSGLLGALRARIQGLAGVS